MNRNYGRLVGGEVEYAPAKITKDDGTVVMSPSAETYLAAGWKPKRPRRRPASFPS